MKGGVWGGGGRDSGRWREVGGEVDRDSEWWREV